MSRADDLQNLKTPDLPDPCLIRSERECDFAAIGDVITRAFAVAEHASGTEAAIVERLRQNGKLAVSLVAEIEGRIVGHAAASPVTISDGALGWFGIGPVAVDPALQRRGIGGRLVREILANLVALEASGCVVLGEPAFYGRFGFRASGQLIYPGMPGEYFQEIAWKTPIPSGIVGYDVAFE
ncbi:GNAT family N-acetyltransferase [bacterium]|nr:GNAT family N-acetyltransferase [bacterium]